MLHIPNIKVFNKYRINQPSKQAMNIDRIRVGWLVGWLVSWEGSNTGSSGISVRMTTRSKASKPGSQAFSALATINRSHPAMPQTRRSYSVAPSKH
jgi:hypothetical protein